MSLLFQKKRSESCTLVTSVVHLEMEVETGIGEAEPQLPRIGTVNFLKSSDKEPKRILNLIVWHWSLLGDFRLLLQN